MRIYRIDTNYSISHPCLVKQTLKPSEVDFGQFEPEASPAYGDNREA